MACSPLVSQLKALIREYESSNDNSQQPLVCPPTTEPCATCCMVCPPPILAPTVPEPVKPLQLPCPIQEQQEPEMSPEQAERTRYANFYNNYNIDYHAESGCNQQRALPDPRKNKCNGVTTDGKGPCCRDKKKEEVEDKGCPTGIKGLRAIMEGASMKNCNFKDPAGQRANLEGVNIKGACLEDSDMGGVNLRIANCKNANLRNCDLRAAVLAGADLEFCDLSGSDLHEANLRGANLKDAAFELMLTPLHMSQTIR